MPYITCSNCGSQIYVTRHGKKGEGAHYAKQIVRLSKTHKTIIEVLKESYAYDFLSGLDLNEVWNRVAVKYKEKGWRLPSKAGVCGRLSELQGLGYTKSEHNITQLIDPSIMKFRAPRNSSRWFLKQNLLTIQNLLTRTNIIQTKNAPETRQT